MGPCVVSHAGTYWHSTHLRQLLTFREICSGFIRGSYTLFADKSLKCHEILWNLVGRFEWRSRTKKCFDSVNLVQWRTHESFQWDVLMLPVILSYFSIVVKLVLVKCFDMLYIKQYVWVYEYVNIDFDFISCILCDICMTELFALCVLYFVRDDKIKMFNQKKVSFFLLFQVFMIMHCLLNVAKTPWYK